MAKLHTLEAEAVRLSSLFVFPYSPPPSSRAHQPFGFDARIASTSALI
jgi:hypothetical protein